MLRRKSSPLSRGGLYPSDKILKNQIIHHQGYWDTDVKNILKGSNFGIASDSRGDYIAVAGTQVPKKGLRATGVTGGFESRIWFYQNQTLLFSRATEQDSSLYSLSNVSDVHITENYILFGNFTQSTAVDGIFVEVYDYSGNYVCKLSTNISGGHSFGVCRILSWTVSGGDTFAFAGFNKAAAGGLTRSGVVCCWNISGSLSGTVTPTSTLLGTGAANHQFGINLDIEADGAGGARLLVGERPNTTGKVWVYSIPSNFTGTISQSTTYEKVTPATSDALGTYGLACYEDKLSVNIDDTSTWEKDLSDGVSTIPNTPTFNTVLLNNASRTYFAMNKNTRNIFHSSYANMNSIYSNTLVNGSAAYSTSRIDRYVRSGTDANPIWTRDVPPFIDVNTSNLDGFGFNIKNTQRTANYMLFGRPNKNQLDVYDANTETFAFTLELPEDSLPQLQSLESFGSFGFPFAVSDNYFMDSICVKEFDQLSADMATRGGDTQHRIYDKNFTLLYTLTSLQRKIGSTMLPSLKSVRGSFDMNDTYIVRREIDDTAVKHIGVYDTASGTKIWNITFPTSSFQTPHQVVLVDSKLYVSVSEVVSVDTIDRGYVFIYELDRFTGATDKAFDDWASWRVTNTATTNTRAGYSSYGLFTTDSSSWSRTLHTDGGWIAALSTTDDDVYLYNSSNFAAAPTTLGSGPTVISSEDLVIGDTATLVNNIFIKGDKLYKGAPLRGAVGRIDIYDLSASPVSSITINGVNGSDRYGAFLYVDDEDRLYTSQNDSSENDFIVFDSNTGNEISKNALSSEIKNDLTTDDDQQGGLEVSGNYLYFANPYSDSDRVGRTWKIPLKKVFG